MKSTRQIKDPWFTDKLKEEIKVKNTFFIDHKSYPFSPKLKARYVKQRNFVSALIKKAKKEYYSKIISNTSDSQKLRKIINKACRRKQQITQHICDMVNADSKVISDKYEIAAKFNKFFTEIGSNLAAAISDIDIASTILHYSCCILMI